MGCCFGSASLSHCARQSHRAPSTAARTSGRPLGAAAAAAGAVAAVVAVVRGAAGAWEGVCAGGRDGAGRRRSWGCRAWRRR